MEGYERWANLQGYRLDEMENEEVLKKAQIDELEPDALLEKVE